MALDLELEFVECRTGGHAWDWFVPSGRQPKWGTWFALRCDRCGTERFDTLGIYGQLVGRRYDYPEGYQYAKGEEVPTRDDFRKDLVGKLKDQARARMNGNRSNGRRS